MAEVKRLTAERLGREPEKPLQVVVWGLGAMGRIMAHIVAADPRLALAGAVSRRAAPDGFTDISDLTGAPRKTGRPARPTLDQVLTASGGGDIVLQATSSFVRDAAPEVEECLEHDLDVVSIAEEMAYPWASSPETAERLDRMARDRGRTVLGTGVNPGFVLDTLIACLSGASAGVRSVYASRVNDLSPFGPTVMRTQGVGLSPQEFARGVGAGTVVGHIGFPESMHLIARALGVNLSRVEQNREPIITRIRRETPYVVVEPGYVAGCRHSARGYVGERVVIELDHPQQIHPEAEGTRTGDYIRIEGTPTIEMRTNPEIPGGLATAALAVNMLPPVVAAAPGLVTMLDLPVPRGSLNRAEEWLEIV